MKTITITPEEVLNGFKQLAALPNDTHRKILNKYTLKCDCNNDIEATLNGHRYWIITEPIITQLNKVGEYTIKITYQIREGTKSGNIMYKFAR